MKVSVHLFASLRERAGRAELELADLPDGADVALLKRELEERHPELGPLTSVRCAIGTEYASDGAPLSEGASVALIPPVSGGAPPEREPGPAQDAALERGVFELDERPLDPAACQRRVEHPSCGAAVVFTGSVRDENRGRAVVRLEYEAFAEMTGPEMARLFERCRGEPELAGARLRMLVRHRTGTLAVGEPSVVVAVASPHRDPAFRACRFLIDALKESLPIWKKEAYPGGEEWIGERS